MRENGGCLLATVNKYLGLERRIVIDNGENISLETELGCWQPLDHFGQIKAHSADKNGV